MLSKSKPRATPIRLTSTSATDESFPPISHSPLQSPLLPDEPLVTIQPKSSWSVFDLRELWSYRELLYFLTWRDVKVRYKQTALGASWAILQPLFMMVIFTLFFGRMAGLKTAVPYSLFAMAGLVPWTFFANAISMGGNSMVNSSHLLSKVYFPRLLIPAAAVAAGLVDFLLSFLMLTGMLIFYRVPLTANLLLLPPLLILTIVLSFGVSSWLAAVNVKYRDVRFVLPFLIQIWLFISSVILPSSSLSGKWRRLLLLNPMSAIIEGYRAALFGFPIDWMAIAVAAFFSFAIVIWAAIYVRRMERYFADFI